MLRTVVTSFEFRLHSVGPTVLAGPILWDASDAGEVLRLIVNSGDRRKPGAPSTIRVILY
jgi:hypothetical protein